MKDLRLWDKQSNVNLMGKVHTPQQLITAYPVQTDGECVLEYISPNIAGGIDNLATLASVFGVETTGTPQEILDAILVAMETPPAIEPDANERIAAALEYQNMVTM